MASLYMESKFVFSFLVAHSIKGEKWVHCQHAFKKMNHNALHNQVSAYIWLSAFVNSLQSRNSYKVT